MFTVSELPSSLPVLTAPAGGVESVTVTIFAGAGSRYEEEKERGISHFLEHMFFKGGKKYPTTKDVSVAIDSVGGEFNAFTGKEYAGYYVKVSSDHLELACDVLSDMLRFASFPPEEIKKESGVIIEEERMYQDTPMYRAGWDFEELLYGDHPLGWDTIGKQEVIKSVKQEDFRKHKDLLYTPDNLVAAFAGNVGEAKAMELSEKYFGDIDGKKARTFREFKKYGNDKVFLREKKTEQSHLVLGVPSVRARDKDHFANKLLEVILGGSMSSRMFLNIREAKGLCYYISTETDSYLDGGSLSTRAGVDQSRLEEAIQLIRTECEVCAKDGITTAELTRAKDYLKGKVTLSLEDTEERGHFFGKQALLYPEVYDIPEYFRRIEAVDREQVNALAEKIFAPENYRLVVIGQVSDKGRYEKLIS